MTRALLAILATLLTVASADATSTINPTLPSQNSSLSSSVVRNNFIAAYNDVNNVLGKFAGSVAPTNQTALQDWVDTSASPVYKFKFWNPSTSTWVQWGSLNISTGVFSVTATSGSFAATAPITLGIVAGVATYGLSADANFAVSGGSLALAPVANGHLIANCSGGSAEPGNCAWSAFADQAVGSTNGQLPYRTGGSWSTISTGTSGATIPLNNSANVFSAAQSIVTNTTSLPAADTGALLILGNVDGTPTRIELTSAGSNAVVSGRTALGTMAVPLTLTSGTLMMSYNAHGYDGTSWATVANGAFRIYAEGTWSNTSHPTETCMSTTPSASVTIADQWCVHASGGATIGSPTGGDKGIGTVNATGLYVSGVAVTAAGITALTGDATATGPGSAVLTLPNINVAVGTFGSPTQSAQVILNAKGQVTSASNATITPAVGSITGLGTGVAAALANNLNASGGLASSASPAFSGTATGDFTLSGNITHSGQLIATGTSSPASAAGNTLVLGTLAGAPTLSSNGMGTLYNSSSAGAVILGKGSSTDVYLGSSSGVMALSVATGTANIIIGGKLAAASLSTTGTIGGSLCRTAGGDIIYNSAVNCFTSGAATSIAPGTTTISPTTTNNLLYDNAGIVGERTIASILTAGSGISITGTTNATIALSLNSQVLSGLPANPTGTGSGSPTMMGLGATCKITPTYSTRVFVMFNGGLTNSTTSDQAQTLAKFGTGTAPTNGSAVAGTSFGSLSNAFIPVGTAQVPFANGGIITGLTPGTAYWFDEAVSQVVGGTASINNVACNIMEVL